MHDVETDGRASSGQPLRWLSDRGGGRARRDGDGLPRRARAPAPPGRAEGADARTRRGARLPRALHPRVACRGDASCTRTSSPSTTPARSTACCILAMQFVEGEDLARAAQARRAARAGARAASVIAQIAAALDAAHERGLVHRDVKPANVLVEGDHCYVADFGLTKLTGATARDDDRRPAGHAQLRRAGADRGRRASTAAPTSTRSAPRRTSASSGETPFAHRSGAALLYAQLTEAPPRPTDRRPDLPAAVDAVLARALAKAPADRFATCGEFAAALTGALVGSDARRPRPRPCRPRGRRPAPAAADALPRAPARWAASRSSASSATRSPRRATGGASSSSRRRAGDRQDAARGRARGARLRRRRDACSTAAPTRTR